MKMDIASRPGHGSPPLTDLEISLRAARTGSQEAIGQLLQAYRPYLAAVAERQIAGDLQAKVGVSDLVQDTYAEAFKAFPAFRGRTEAELRTWLQQILVNNAVSVANHYRRTAKRRLQRERSLDDGPTAGLAASLQAAQRSPGSQAQRNEEAEILEEALAGLPEDYRRVIVLHHRENLPFDEVARRLGRTEAATRKLWARAVERWRFEVESRYGKS
jgi:RNA polymerase sigma-70 factor (ECF subfamily)